MARSVRPDTAIGEEVADLLHALARRMRQAGHEEFGPLGVTPSQARAMRVLGRAGRPLRMSELADALRIARRSATSVVDELVEVGLVERITDPADRRSVAVVPSAAGHEVLRQLVDRRRTAGAKLVAQLPARDAVALRDLLRRLDSE